MSIKIYSPGGRTTIHWTSGTSTEMLIYPGGGSFADREFLFRISTATVEAEESTFTFFEGITRHLMILRGELELIHEGRYTKHLKPYDQDTFSGAWTTRSKGRVTDFNLMLKGKASGSLTHLTIMPEKPALLSTDSDFYFVYIASGSAALDGGRMVTAGDLIEVIGEALIQLDGEGNLVVVRVMLNP